MYFISISFHYASFKTVNNAMQDPKCGRNQHYVQCLPERACEPATYEVYGISTTDSGANRLKGPSVNANGYGVTQMGGMTPFRSIQVDILILSNKLI